MGLLYRSMLDFQSWLKHMGVRTLLVRSRQWAVKYERGSVWAALTSCRIVLTIRSGLSSLAPLRLISSGPSALKNSWMGRSSLPS